MNGLPCARPSELLQTPTPQSQPETLMMTKREFADEIINYAIDVAMDDLKLVQLGDADRRAKLYRKAGLELVAMAAQMDAERTFGV